MVRAKYEVNKAYEEGYAIGSFNICNLETFQALVEVSEEINSPVFMGTTNSSIKYMGLENIKNLRKGLNRTKVILHLDHGSYENAKECIRKGYHSVMFDGASLSLEENIEKTKKIVKMAHKRNIIVEGEVGTFTKKGLTRVKDAVKFVKETNVDLLAVSIGNKHGFYETSPVIDFERLKRINESVNTPLVLHGGSGLNNNVIKLILKNGVVKINIDTELRWAYTNAIRDFLNKNSMNRYDKNCFDLRNYLGRAKESYKKIVLEKIKLFH